MIEHIVAVAAAIRAAECAAMHRPGSSRDPEFFETTDANRERYIRAALAAVERQLRLRASAPTLDVDADEIVAEALRRFGEGRR